MWKFGKMEIHTLDIESYSWQCATLVRYLSNFGSLCCQKYACKESEIVPEVSTLNTQSKPCGHGTKISNTNSSMLLLVYNVTINMYPIL